MCHAMYVRALQTEPRKQPRHCSSVHSIAGAEMDRADRVGFILKKKKKKIGLASGGLSGKANAANMGCLSPGAGFVIGEA